MTNSTFSRQLAQHVVADHSISAELDEWMRLLLQDYFAATTGGRGAGSALAARAAVPSSPTRSDLLPSALHTGGGFAAPRDAALVNGITAHGLELDDTFEESSLHPGVVVFPAVLALADGRGSTWGQVLQASVLGYDVMCSVGVLLGASESYGRGFHPTGVAGALGAAAATSVLLGLNEDETVHALGLAANMAAGSLEFLFDGSWTKRLNDGNAAATGIRAGQLAAAGFTGPETSIEGRDGFLRQYGRGEVPGRNLHLEFGRGAFGRGALDTSIKFYPCCRYLHGNIDLLRAIHDDYPSLTVTDVASIEVAVITAGAALVAEPAAPKKIIVTPVDAQFSMPFGAAVALSTGTTTVGQFDDAPNVALGLDEWIDKVTCYTSPTLEAAFPARWQAEVRVVLANGTVIERSEEAFRGAPGNRATAAELRGKAEGLMGATGAAALAAAVDSLLHDVALVDQCLVPVAELPR